jgi:hypothetical protein
MSSEVSNVLKKRNVLFFQYTKKQETKNNSIVKHRKTSCGEHLSMKIKCKQ